MGPWGITGVPHVVIDREGHRGTPWPRPEPVAKAVFVIDEEHPAWQCCDCGARGENDDVSANPLVCLGVRRGWARALERAGPG